MTAVTISNLSKSYQSRSVLADINFSIKKGEIFGLLGPSGSGKTTLIKMIIGMEKPNEGEIHVLDTVMPNLPVLNQIGYMGQADALYEDLTAKENLSFFATLYGLKKHERKIKIDQVLNLVDLQDHKDKKTGQFSGGMKRRLSLAIALLHNPVLLALDEPTVGIDPLLRKSIWNELEQLKKNGVSILVTTHVMDEAEKCDRLALIRDGRLIGVNTPKGFKEQYGTSSIEEIFLMKRGDEA
ncbi:ABC transporter ATP-binding protein [Bacillus gobiensis]|uniref:ABC transporter ATP-binding protein n=1 Tax=Bacillus gobiensis TaxID=1441095 RepID=UPI003D21609B